MKKKTPKIPFQDVAIETWQPTRDGQPWIAMFVWLPMIFKGPKEVDVVSAAIIWRDEEMAREDKKKANAKATSERMKARAEAAQ